jgi:hypothetical protein
MTLITAKYSYQLAHVRMGMPGAPHHAGLFALGC